MKRSYLAVLISVAVLITTGLWIFNSNLRLSLTEIVSFGIIFILIVFGFYFGFSRLRSIKRGEPAQDELSKKIMQKASSLSYFISLYLWVGMIYVSDKIKADTHVILGTGILAMSIVLAVCWVFLKIKGIKDA
jgi:peptidoglycan/LPS O-acetylase OafA/YrhL